MHASLVILSLGLTSIGFINIGFIGAPFRYRAVLMSAMIAREDFIVYSGGCVGLCWFVSLPNASTA
jgi:hypothetical protein